MRPPPETGSGSAPREEPTALRALRVSRRSRATHAAQPVHAHTRAVCAVPAASLNGVGASGRSTAPAGSALGIASPGFPAVRGSPPNEPRRCAPHRAPRHTLAPVGAAAIRPRCRAAPHGEPHAHHTRSRTPARPRAARAHHQRRVKRSARFAPRVIFPGARRAARRAATSAPPRARAPTANQLRRRGPPTHAHGAARAHARSRGMPRHPSSTPPYPHTHTSHQRPCRRRLARAARSIQVRSGARQDPAGAAIFFRESFLPCFHLAFLRICSLRLW